MKRQKQHNKFPVKADVWLMVLGIPLVALLNNTLLFGFLLQDHQYYAFSSCILISLVITIIYWFSFRYVYMYNVEKFPLESQNKTRRISTITMQLIVFIMIQLLIEKTMVYLDDPIFSAFKPSLILKIITSLIFSVLVIALYEIIFLSHQISLSIKEKEELKRENIASELSGLKEQINPHFLFNSLNTLSALIATQPQRAESFVAQLAKVYRYILDKGDEDLVTLQQEITYLQAYIHLLKERFGDSLIIHMQGIDDEVLSKKIIPLSLQICFENCVKHNIVTLDQPLSVNLSVMGENYIYISNNLQPLHLNEPASGVGIQNIKKRYSYFTAMTVKVDVNEKTFTIGLPLL